MGNESNERVDLHSSIIPAERIERAILLIRGEKIILDVDLAGLYGVTTKQFNQFSLTGAKELEKGGYHAVILAVAHDKFREMDMTSLKRGDGVIYDVKSFLDPAIVDGRL
jgi:UDP-N-acetyl-D-mannosaminuronate dehydrogenase